MDIDDDDDFYAPDEAVPEIKPESEETPAADTKTEPTEEKDLEEGEEEVEEGEEVDEGEEAEDDDSDIDIITEHKDGTKPPAPSAQPRYNAIPGAKLNKPSTPTKASGTSIKKEISPRTAAAPSGGGDLPAVSTSKVNINAKPLYPPAGKAITALDIDADLPDNDKPWRRPGADVSDFFNYGFDEFTWALYATKQESLRSEFSADKVAQSNKKMMEEMSSMMMMGGMPMGGMPGMTAPDGSAMTPEMMAMMQQMMGAGMDATQMGEQMFAGGMQGGAAGGQAGYGQGYGYDQGNMNGGGGGGGGGRGGFSGRGRRGGRGGW